MRGRACIISFSPIERDARVLRQLEYLSPQYQLCIIGYGSPNPPWPGVEWRPVPLKSDLFTRALGLLLMVLGRLLPFLYDRWYWLKAHHRLALQYALECQADVYHANDWNALPVAAEAARRHKAKLVLDAHEFAPMEFYERLHWRIFYRPLVIHMLKRYAPRLDASTTVAPAIAERYAREFGFEPVTVLNAPKLVPVEAHSVDPANVRLVYHGGASPDRKLERLIETMALAHPRYSLHFLMVDQESPYVRSLKDLSARLVPERIHFHPPVPPAQIVQRIAEYDIGFYLLEPSNYNNSVALPNKFFDFMAAGLAVLIGPSPGMADLVKRYGFGCVTTAFSSAEAAATLNALDLEQIGVMRQAALRTAQLFNADTEMAKLVDLYRSVLLERN
jgi:glycosyltransferase involved in cell wall biosynthesis